MHPLAPFTPATARPYCPLAWQSDVPPGRPAYRYWSALQQVQAGGIHDLLGMAQLPRAELLYMGWPPVALTADPGARLNLELVAPLLGRIVLDARELVWSDELLPEAMRLGLAVVKRRFVCC